jgi:hypothetical protein
MNNPQHPKGDGERMRIKALARWEGEGGAILESASAADSLDASTAAGRYHWSRPP